MMVSKYIQSNAGPDAGPSETKAPLNLGNKNNVLMSVHFKNTDARAILSSFKDTIIFNNISADFVLISADVLLKIIIILKELRIALCNCVLKVEKI